MEQPWTQLPDCELRTPAQQQPLGVFAPAEHFRSPVPGGSEPCLQNQGFPRSSTRSSPQSARARGKRPLIDFSLVLRIGVGRFLVMELDPFEWYWSLPIVTRSFLTATFALTAGCAVDLINPLLLYYNYDLIFRGGEVRCSRTGTAICSGAPTGPVTAQIF